MSRPFSENFGALEVLGEGTKLMVSYHGTFWTLCPRLVADGKYHVLKNWTSVVVSASACPA